LTHIKTVIGAELDMSVLSLGRILSFASFLLLAFYEMDRDFYLCWENEEKGHTMHLFFLF